MGEMANVSVITIESQFIASFTEQHIELHIKGNVSYH
jgi:hypothetical protein